MQLIHLLENLIDSGFGHRKFEEDSEETYHDQRSWCPHNRSITKLYEETQHLEHLQDHGQPEEDHHTSVELAPVVLQIGLVPLCKMIKPSKYNYIIKKYSRKIVFCCVLSMIFKIFDILKLQKLIYLDTLILLR